MEFPGGEVLTVISPLAPDGIRLIEAALVTPFPDGTRG